MHHCPPNLRGVAVIRLALRAANGGYADRCRSWRIVQRSVLQAALGSLLVLRRICLSAGGRPICCPWAGLAYVTLPRRKKFALVAQPRRSHADPKIASFPLHAPSHGASPAGPVVTARGSQAGISGTGPSGISRSRRDPAADLYGAFPVKRLFWVLLTVLCSERERPFFVPSPAIRFPERAEGVKGPKR